MNDPVERQAVLDTIRAMETYKLFEDDDTLLIDKAEAQTELRMLPSAQPERLTDDVFETIRIHLSAAKERLCNQRRWKEAEEYQELIDRFMAFASAQPEPQWIPCSKPPEESGTYIVTAYDGTDKRVTFVKYQKTLKRWDLTGARAYWRILAYKPLPGPWRGEE